MAKKCTATCTRIKEPKIYQFFIYIGTENPICIEAEKYEGFCSLEFKIGKEIVAIFSENSWKYIVRGPEVIKEYQPI